MYQVVVGIDFGSSGSGYAYSFMNDNDINHGYIYGSNVDNKVPTEIILDDDNYIVQFGAGCKQYLKEKGINTGHYFKDIKMHLYENKSSIKSQNSDKEIPLKIVIQRIFWKIKEIFVKEISIYRPYLLRQTDKIKWVITDLQYWKKIKKI